MPRGKKRCELGLACPYQHEYQHSLEFTHSNSESKAGSVGGNGGGAGKGRKLGGSNSNSTDTNNSPKRSRGNTKRFPGSGVVLSTGAEPKKRVRKPKQQGQTLGQAPGVVREPKPVVQPQQQQQPKKQAEVFTYTAQKKKEPSADTKKVIVID